MKKTVVALVLATLAGTVLAQQLKPEEMIKTRKANFTVMAWNMGKIKANLDGNFDKDQVAAAANTVAAVAGSGWSVLFAPGTDKDIGGERTRVKPEFFQQPDRARELGLNLRKEAGELARVAATGDKAAVQAQFGKTGAACKACHDDFRK